MAMEYYRPETIKEALQLLKKGIPLAGGTMLTPERFKLEAVIDLQDLGMDGCEQEDGELVVGAMTRVEDLLRFEGSIPRALYEAGQLESGLNLRNMVTIGGLIMSADARSPLLTALVALRTQVNIEPGEKVQKIGKVLEGRSQGKKPFIITGIQIPLPSRSTYASVARSPADFPLVSAAAAVTHTKQGRRRWVIALGGYGSAPARYKAEIDPSEEDVSTALDGIARWATDTYAQAGDSYASATYRSNVAGVLVCRVLKEVLEG